MAAGRKKPSQTYDMPWIWQQAPRSVANTGHTLGKWLVFRPVAEIDEMWEKIRKPVESGELGATGAKVSTVFKHPSMMKYKDKVICVYTTQEDMDEVGLKLIQVVQDTIRYKTNEATQAGRYSWSVNDKISCRTLQWNGGNPIFTD